MAAVKKIGVLTSGGDCAGLNAVVRAVVHRAIEGYGWEVLGIRNGTAGLLARPVETMPLSLGDFTGNLLRQGGTVLGTTNKGNPFDYPLEDGSRIDRSGEVIEGYHPGHGTRFSKAALNRRGVTAWVEREGEIREGDAIDVHIPPQRIWAPGG